MCEGDVGVHGILHAVQGRVGHRWQEACRCVHAYADRVYMHKPFRVHMPGIRQGSNHTPDGAGHGAAGAAFEAAVNGARQSGRFPPWRPRAGAAGSRLPTGARGRGSGTPGLRLWVCEWQCIWQECVCVRAAAGVRVGCSYLIGARSTPAQLHGPGGPRKGERAPSRPQGLPEARTGPA